MGDADGDVVALAGDVGVGVPDVAVALAEADGLGGAELREVTGAVVLALGAGGTSCGGCTW